MKTATPSHSPRLLLVDLEGNNGSLPAASLTYSTDTVPEQWAGDRHRGHAARTLIRIPASRRRSLSDDCAPAEKGTRPVPNGKMETGKQGQAARRGMNSLLRLRFSQS